MEVERPVGSKCLNSGELRKGSWGEMVGVVLQGENDRMTCAMSSCFFNAQWTDSFSKGKKSGTFKACDSESCAHLGRSPAGHQTLSFMHYIDYLIVRHKS